MTILAVSEKLAIFVKTFNMVTEGKWKKRARGYLALSVFNGSPCLTFECNGEIISSSVDRDVLDRLSDQLGLQVQVINSVSSEKKEGSGL